MTFQTPEQVHDEELVRFLQFLAVVLGGGIKIKPVHLCSEPTTFYSVPQCVDRATEQNYRDNLEELVRYARRCCLFKGTAR